MSGITGIYNMDGREVDRNLLKRMTGSIAHRGCGELFYFDENMGLGYRSQAVPDILNSGHQFLFCEDNRYLIIHDGHIYNHPELRRELENTGCRFHTGSDVEVILYSYKQWGVDCLNRFNGMWAFAIWDRQRKELFCARDRFGVKPFYYYFDGKVFIFASEIKALLEHPCYYPEVNEKAVYNYLMLGLFETSGDTFFKNIEELSPSHFLHINNNRGITVRRWWSLNVNPDSDNSTDNDASNAAWHFRMLLEDAVRLRIGNEPITGVTLSGGLDSSTITVLAGNIIREKHAVEHPHISDRLKTFSSCYKDSNIDEDRFIDTIVRETGAEGNTVFPDGYKLWEELPGLLWHHDEPCDVASIYARWSMMKRANEVGLKAILEGDGGDVLLAGHYRYYGNFFIELVLKREIVQLLNEVKKASSIVGARDLASHTSTVLGGVMYTRLPLSFQVNIINPLLKLRGRSTNKVLTSSFASRFLRYGLARLSEEYGKSALNLQQDLLMRIPALTRPLRYSDRSSAPFSIETRAPLLDYRLVEYSFSLPASLKIRNGWTKWILRQCMQDILPDQIRLRKDKSGFPTPIRTWLLLNREKIKGLFCDGNTLSSRFINAKYIEDNLDELLGNKKSAQELWRYINLELWLRVFFGDRV